MSTLVIVAVVAALGIVLAQVMARRKPDPPTQASWGVPSQLDRSDFADPKKPWLVACFTSETCDSCEAMVPKVEVLSSQDVAVAVLPFQDHKDTHKRYGIDAVPTVVMADDAGVVRWSAIGPKSAADLWAAIAELREPGSTPPPEAHVPV